MLSHLQNKDRSHSNNNQNCNLTKEIVKDIPVKVNDKSSNYPNLNSKPSPEIEKSQNSEGIIQARNIRLSNYSDNNSSNSKSKDIENIKDFFSNNKKKSEVENCKELSKSNNNSNNANEEELEFEMNTKNNKEEENNNFKAFLKASLKKGINQNLAVTKETTEEVECSRQMLIEMSKFNDNFGDKERENPDHKDILLPKSISDEDFLKNNQIPENEANQVKDDIIEKKHNDPQVILDENEDEEIEFDCRQIIFQNKEEVELLTQELTSCLGERVFKAAYKLVYDNVS